MESTLVTENRKIKEKYLAERFSNNEAKKEAIAKLRDLGYSQVVIDNTISGWNKGE